MVHDVVNIRQISPLPKEVDKISNKYVSGVSELEDGRVVLIMDTDLVIGMDII